jgi:cytochrome c oxidase subunit 4
MAEHVTSRKVYFMVFGALLVLTLLTVLAAQVDLGAFNDVVALTIAVTKAMLVILFFMHVRHSTRMTVLTALAGFFWLAILLGLTLADYASRGRILEVRQPGGQVLRVPGK